MNLARKRITSANTSCAIRKTQQTPHLAQARTPLCGPQFSWVRNVHTLCSYACAHTCMHVHLQGRDKQLCGYCFMTK